jgi:hypothetical protein
MESIKETYAALKNMNKKQFVMQGINLGVARHVVPKLHCINPEPRHRAGLIVSSALIIWKSLMLFTGSESPVRTLHTTRRTTAG